MNSRLILRSLPQPPDFDPTTEFPEDIERLVMVAINAGYQLTPQDAAELWRRHVGAICASWFAVTGDDQDILATLLRHAEILAGEANRAAPPDGYVSWLDNAVDAIDTRFAEMERFFLDRPASRESMRDAVRTEYMALRRKAGEFQTR